MPNTSPNMGLIVPIAATVGVTGSGDTGPGYASNISTDLLTTIDGHDHSSGKGVQITPAGININADLTVNSNNLTQIRASRYSSQGTAINGAQDISCVYVVNGNLYYNNSAGTSIQLTSGGSLLQGPTGPAGTPNVANYFQGGVTGATALQIQYSGIQNGVIQWNNQTYAAGTIMTPTTVGSGASQVLVNIGGLYEVSYQFNLFAGPYLLSPSVGQYLQATGIYNQAGSSGVANSLSYLTVPTGLFSTGAPSGTVGSGIIFTISNDYVAKFASGTYISTWVVNPNPTGTITLSPTGSHFTIKLIG